MPDQDPVLVLRIIGDWSNIDQGIEQRQAAAQSGSTFGTEARGGARFGGGGAAAERVVRAQERMAESIEGTSGGTIGWGTRGGRSGFFSGSMEAYFGGSGAPASDWAQAGADPSPRRMSRSPVHARITEQDVASLVGPLWSETSRHERGGGQSGAFTTGAGILAGGPDQGGYLSDNKAPRWTTRHDWGGGQYESISTGSQGLIAEGPVGGEIENEDDYFPMRARNRRASAGRGTGGMGVFYKRFLLMEGLRSVSDMMQAQTKYNVGMTGAMGDIYATGQLQVDASLGKGFTGSIPFGVGGLGAGISDLLTGNESAANATLSQGRAQEQHIAAMGGQQEFRMGYSGAATVMGASRGLSRDMAALEGERSKNDRAITANAAGLVREVGTRQRLDIEANAQSIPYWVQGYADFVWGGDRSKMGQGIADMDARARGIDSRAAGERSKITADMEKSRADNDKVFAIKKGEAVLDAVLTAQGAASQGILMGVQALQVMTPSGNAAFDPRIQAQQSAQQQRMQFAQMVNTQNSDFDKALATQGIWAYAGRVGQLGQRALTYANMEQGIATEAEAARRSVIEQIIGYTEAADISRAGILRSPERAIGARHEAAMARTSLMAPDLSRAGRMAADEARDEATQKLADHRESLSGALALREAVTGKLAQAYGPGAGDIRREAMAMQTAGETELEAQGYLRADSGPVGLGQADTARRTGINRLKMQQAEYIQSLRAVGSSPYDINTRGINTGSNPDRVLDSIENAQRGVGANIGNNNVAGSNPGGANSLPVLFQQLINAITGGVPAGD